MSRDVDAAVITELQAAANRPVFLVEIELDASFLRYSTHDRDLTWNSETWLGNGFLKKIAPIGENLEVGSLGASVEIVGEPSALVSVALNDVRQNRDARIYLGFLNSSDAIITDPILLFWGIVDTVELRDGPEVSTLSFFFENELLGPEGNTGLRYNAETQEELFSGDLGFEYLPQMNSSEWYWGKVQEK